MEYVSDQFYWLFQTAVSGIRLYFLYWIHISSSKFCCSTCHMRCFLNITLIKKKCGIHNRLGVLNLLETILNFLSLLWVRVSETIYIYIYIWWRKHIMDSLLGWWTEIYDHWGKVSSIHRTCLSSRVVQGKNWHVGYRDWPSKLTRWVIPVSQMPTKCSFPSFMQRGYHMVLLGNIYISCWSRRKRKSCAKQTQTGHVKFIWAPIMKIKWVWNMMPTAALNPPAVQILQGQMLQNGLPPVAYSTEIWLRIMKDLLTRHGNCFHNWILREEMRLTHITPGAFHVLVFPSQTDRWRSCQTQMEIACSVEGLVLYEPHICLLGSSSVWWGRHALSCPSAQKPNSANALNPTKSPNC